MFRRTSLALRVLTPVALCACLLATPATGANPPAKPKPPTKPDTNTKLDPKKLNDEIKKHGRLEGKHYWNVAEARHGKKKSVAATPFHKPKVENAAPGGVGPKALVANNGNSTLTTVGGDNLPAGFGKGFTWDRSQDEALLVLFINAADPLGISIDGIQAGDIVQVVSASGLASYKSDKGNPLASSIVGLVAAGANVAATALGAPEVAPAITAGETFAKDQFKATNAKTLIRDAFGVEPKAGGKARQEGGLLVCLPEAGGTYYSGESKNRWIQGKGDRTDDMIPQHIFGSFFPRQGFPDHNTRTCQQSGVMYVLPWDFDFDDNAGYYKVYLKLKKGNGPPPPPIIERKPNVKK
jgi:hypothetical protein